MSKIYPQSFAVGRTQTKGARQHDDSVRPTLPQLCMHSMGACIQAASGDTKQQLLPCEAQSHLCPSGGEASTLDGRQAGWDGEAWAQRPTIVQYHEPCSQRRLSKSTRMHDLLVWRREGVLTCYTMVSSGNTGHQTKRMQQRAVAYMLPMITGIRGCTAGQRGALQECCCLIGCSLEGTLLPDDGAPVLQAS